MYVIMLHVLYYVLLVNLYFLNFFPFSSKEDAGGGDDLLRSASKTAENGDPQIRSILSQLLSEAKQPPRTRIRLKIELYLELLVYKKG
jgi:hypothetical protein